MRLFRAGLLYCAAYAVVAWLLSGHLAAARVFGNFGMFVVPGLLVWAILRRRHDWAGCQWLFWAAFLLGVSLWTLGQVGWAFDELLFGRDLPWLRWHSILQLFGSLAPVLALLARPQAGVREDDVAPISLDIVAIAIVTGFLYSFFIVAPSFASSQQVFAMTALDVFVSLQRTLLLAGAIWAVYDARLTPWRPVYTRILAGAAIGIVLRELSLRAVAAGTYHTGSVYDLSWMLPLACYIWAAEAAPSSAVAVGTEATATDARNRQPLLIFAALAVVPIVAYAGGQLWPLRGPLAGFRDLSVGVTLVSMLALLMGRFAIQRLALKEADARSGLLAKALEQTDGLVMILHRDSRVAYANSAFCRALRREANELRGTPATALFAESSRHLYDELTGAALSRGASQGNLLRQRADGSTFFTACSVVPLFDAAGGLTHFVWVERDITDDLRMREQLIQSERLSAVGQLVAGVAHEINNPLQSIVGLTELMLATPQEPAIRGDVDRIREAAVRAGRIVRNLLAFVRKSPREREQVNLNEVVESTVALRAYELRAARVDVEEDYFPDLPPVVINREEIQQVVLNLLLNAEQAIASTGRRGCIHLRTGLSGGAVLLEIRDDGPGVPAEVAGRIFEPFFTTREVGTGTGLGLSIAFGIASAHGGSLDLMPSSAGACFRLTLPAVRLARLGGVPVRVA
ncbi:MAG: PAS domain-containing protein [Acidobacteriota bacterium]|nr:PAS domain-containing protein [Acidobacteriota bacterium]